MIRYVSPSCFGILGRRPEEMIGRDFGRFVFSEDVAVFEDIAGAHKCAPVSHARLRLLKKDQTPVWISINARRVHDPQTGRLRESVLAMRDITKRKAQEERLSVLATTDALTGLWNRRAFDRALRWEWKRTSRKKSGLSLLLLDLDHFKPLNDRYGHPLGDACLASVAAAIQGSVRASDVVCRWGGDEIAVILPDTDAAGALKAAEKIRSAIGALCFCAKPDSGERVSVTASIGVATALVQPGNLSIAPQNLLIAADRALYKAKREGQNRVVALTIAPDKPHS